MRISGSDNEQRKLNLTPLIDVVFLLLIFFMVSTTFEKQAKLKIELPEASAEATTAEQDELIITINQNGAFYVNSNQVLNPQAASLQQALLAAVKEQRDMPVILKADANVAHKHVVLAMDVLGQMGFTTVSMATTKPVEK